MAENNVRDDAGDNSREPVFNISPLARGSPDKFAVNSVIMHDLALMLSEKEGGMIYFLTKPSGPPESVINKL